jgi:hypothetical protein
MLNLTNTDLQTKSDAELRGLFAEATRQLAASPKLARQFAVAATAQRLIRDELARRGLRLG